MKTFEEIEAFVRKAMEKELTVCSQYGSNIQVIEDKYQLVFTKYGTCINTRLFNGNNYIGETGVYSLSEREDKEYDILLLDVKQYEADKVMNIFNNFFEEDKPITIDDLGFE